MTRAIPRKPRRIDMEVGHRRSGPGTNRGLSCLVSLGRRGSNLEWTHLSSRAVIFFLLLSYVCCAAAAVSVDAPPMPTTLLIDTRIPIFLDGHWQIMSADEHRDMLIRREQQKGEPESSPIESPASGTAIISSKQHAVTATTATTAETSPLPSPFDGALGANFTKDDKCPEFINEFLSNSTFAECYPVSLLLQGSQSFFEAEKSRVGITQVLDAACQANVTSCTAFFDRLATELISDANCGKDYKLQNAIVVEAYEGMKMYETVYQATCLMGSADQDTIDTSTQANSSSSSSSNNSGSSINSEESNGISDDDDLTSYCFASAVTDSTTTSNTYLYFLPFNSSLPASSAPACGSCTKQTMEIYQAATSDRKADISYQYVAAAEHINSVCGDGFINTTLAAAVEGSATSSLTMSPPTSTLLLASFLVMAISRWIL